MLHKVVYFTKITAGPPTSEEESPIPPPFVGVPAVRFQGCFFVWPKPIRSTQNRHVGTLARCGMSGQSLLQHLSPFTTLVEDRALPFDKTLMTGPWRPLKTPTGRISIGHLEIDVILVNWHELGPVVTSSSQHFTGFTGEKGTSKMMISFSKRIDDFHCNKNHGGTVNPLFLSWCQA